jgi:hypothetical protein
VVVVLVVVLEVVLAVEQPARASTPIINAKTADLVATLTWAPLVSGYDRS